MRTIDDDASRTVQLRPLREPPQVIRRASLYRGSMRVRFDHAAAQRLTAVWQSRRPMTRGLDHAAFAATLILAAISATRLHGQATRGSLPNAAPLSSAASQPESGESAMRPSRSVVIATILAATTTVHAEERRVPEEYPTIQAAIDAAVDGDVVSIAAGEYTESVILSDKAITLRGAGSTLTIWRAPKGSGMVPPRPDNTKAVEIHDICFADFNMPTYPHAAVALNWTAAHVVRGCRFSNCGFFALNVWGGTLIENCEFNGTIGGIAVNTNLSSAQSPHIFRGCVFADNSFSGGNSFPSAIDIYQSTVRIEGCRFARNNYPLGNGVAIRVVASGLLVTNSDFCESSISPVLGGYTDGGGNLITTAECASPCPGDLVDDGIVNSADIAVVLNFWGTNGTQYAGVDLNSDGIVNGADLAAVLGAWGACPE